MIITWFIDPLYHVHIWEGFYDLDKRGVLYSLQGKQIRVITDEDKINKFFEAAYDFDETVTAPYFLCDEWGSTKVRGISK